MQQLSGLDATFLFLETAEMPMHVGAVHLFELPAGHRGRFATTLRKHVAARLPLAPVLRRRLWWMPLNLANPAWVDAEPDLRVHIVEHRLVGPGGGGAGMVELEAAVSELHPQRLDRERPLWKMHVFEGLAPGDNGQRRVGLYTQLHHAAVDGQAAVALANVLLDTQAQPRAVAPRPARRGGVFRLEMTEMLRGVLGNQAQKVADIVRRLPATVGTLKDAATSAMSASELLTGRKGSGNLSLAPRTPLNVSITPARAYATVSLPLPDVRRLGQAFDATVNDLVLMVCSTALRRHLGKQRNLPRKSLVAAVPVTLREKGDATADNQASMSLVSLGTHIADARKRLDHIKAASAAMKSTMGRLKGILPTDYPSLGVPWLIEAVTALYGKAKVADRIPQVANLVISNVPGPAMPLYLAGARMLSNHPASIVVHGLALNITVQSYDQRLDFGLMADGHAMPDVRELADAIRIAFDDLMALPRPGEATDEEDEAPSLVGLTTQATRRLAGGLTGAVTGAVSKAARSVMGSAVEAAVQQVTGRGKAPDGHRGPSSRPRRP